MSSTIDQAREWLGRITQSFSPSTLTFAGLLLAALFPIYCGSHASLSLPSSAAPSAKKSRSAGDSKDASEAEDDDDDLDEAEDDVTSVMSGLQPQDALWFPLAGGLALGGLYVLIKWLEDPALLNKLLNWYFSFLAIVSVRQLLADSLGVATSFVFPQRYRDGSALWRVERGARLFVMEPRGGGGSDDAAAAPAAGGGGARHQDRKLRKPSPFPGLLSRVGLFPALWRWCWAVREALTEKYALHITLRGRKLVRTRFGANDVLGLTASLLAVVAYNFVGQPWWLMNVLSFGLSYNALQLISPRTFWTGTLVLSTLFLYDIYMVFFTPLMVTVAKSLDVPIKLLIPRPRGAHDDPNRTALAMLGLGDVILPGFMISMALRFDLFMWYLRQQTVPRSPKAAASEGEGDGAAPAEAVKATYRSATGRWGERFWTGSTRAGERTEAGSFPKPYFFASVFGYIVGLIITFCVLALSGHPQPALLYLVPGVLLTVWGLGAIRGEVKVMWNYVDSTQEDAEEEQGSKVPKLPAVQPLKKALSAGTAPDYASNINTSSSSRPGTAPAPKELPSSSSGGSSPITEQQQTNHDRFLPAATATGSSTPVGSFSRKKKPLVEDVFSVSITRRAYPLSSSTRAASGPAAALDSAAQSAIVRDIRNALDGDLGLRTSSAAAHTPTTPTSATRRNHSSHAEKRPRLE